MKFVAKSVWRKLFKALPGKVPNLEKDYQLPLRGVAAKIIGFLLICVTFALISSNYIRRIVSIYLTLIRL